MVKISYFHAVYALGRMEISLAAAQKVEQEEEKEDVEAIYRKKKSYKIFLIACFFSFFFIAKRKAINPLFSFLFYV